MRVRSLRALAALVLVLVVVAFVGPRLASGTPLTTQTQAYVQPSEMEALKREVANLEKRLAALERQVATLSRVPVSPTPDPRRGTNNTNK
jgi:hypothetical protein